MFVQDQVVFKIKMMPLNFNNDQIFNHKGQEGMRLSNAKVMIFCDFHCWEFILILNALFQLQRAKLRPLTPTSLTPRSRSSTNQSKCVAARQT